MEATRNATAIAALAEKIQRQERWIEQLQAELHEARLAAAHTLLPWIRLREAVLLYIGQDPDNFAMQITENFSAEIAGTVSRNLFVLDRAPLPVAVRDAVRRAANHGSFTW